MKRLLLDVSSLARWTGPPVGIARVEHALAQASRARGDAERVFWDRQSASFRRLRPEAEAAVLGWQGAIDIPEPGQSLLSRQRWFAALERRRLANPRLSRIAEALQDALLATRPHGHRLRDAQGNRIAHLPPDMVLADPVAPGPGDTILCAGSNWTHLDAKALAEAKRVSGFRYACLCYDLIPITHPQFYVPADVEQFTRHWRATLPVTDLVIVNADCIARDVADFCAAAQIPPPALAVLPLGVDLPAAAASPPLPLRPGHYAVFVSTIEPRKGHAMLLDVWQRLLGRGIPQARDFRLVFVGRPGWMVDDVLARLHAGLDRVHHFATLEDAALAALSAHAAFALYPSHYEGFGLPVIEAFARGKAVLASTGGALPETVGGTYPCLDPDDAPAWEAMIADWIEHGPPSAAPPPVLDWPTAAAAILERASGAS